MDETVGFVGLGNMGGALARNLAAKSGRKVVVHDTNLAAVDALTHHGASAAQSLADLSRRSSAVMTCLPNSAVVEEVILGPDGVLANTAKGAIIIDMSTVSPETTDKLAAACREKGVGFVDCPVGRLVTHAERGEALFMVGAEQEDFDKLEPLFQSMASTIHHCGAPGTGTRTKLVNNYLAIVSCQMNAEAIGLAQSFGLDLAKTLEVIHGTTATNGQLKIAWAAKVFQGDIEPGFAIDLAHKDLTLIVNAANNIRMPMPIGAVARESVSLARAAGYGDKDFSGLADAWCERNGIKPPRL